MIIELTLLEAFGTVFFFILFVVAGYLYQTSKNKEEKGALYMAIAMFLFFIREFLYFIVSAGLVPEDAKLVGSLASGIAGILFLYGFFTQEKVVKDIRRIKNAFK